MEENMKKYILLVICVFISNLASAQANPFDSDAATTVGISAAEVKSPGASKGVSTVPVKAGSTNLAGISYLFSKAKKIKQNHTL